MSNGVKSHAVLLLYSGPVAYCVQCFRNTTLVMSDCLRYSKELAVCADQRLQVEGKGEASEAVAQTEVGCEPENSRTLFVVFFLFLFFSEE